MKWCVKAAAFIFINIKQKNYYSSIIKKTCFESQNYIILRVKTYKTYKIKLKIQKLVKHFLELYIK
jgi:hypothetical protein